LLAPIKQNDNRLPTELRISQPAFAKAAEGLRVIVMRGKEQEFTCMLVINEMILPKSYSFDFREDGGQGGCWV
jgi:hypothetical protein